MINSTMAAMSICLSTLLRLSSERIPIFRLVYPGWTIARGRAVFDIRAKFQSEKVMADVYLAIALFGAGIWANVDGGGPLSQNRGAWVRRTPADGDSAVNRPSGSASLIPDEAGAINCVMSRSRCLFTRDG